MISNLESVSKQEQSDFINSFDQIFLDLDGVVWCAAHALPGAVEAIDALKKMGKKVRYATNNCMWKHDRILLYLEKNKLTPSPEEVVTPVPAIIHYLRSLNFKKSLYVIGTDEFKEGLKSAGFALALDPPEKYESFEEYTEILSTDNEKVGGVIYEYDRYVNRPKLERALTYLRRPECLFIAGSGDKVVPVGSKGHFIWNYHFLKLLREISGREPIQLAKPSSHYNDYIVRNFDIKNPARVLFVGDSIPEDMKLATEGGYQKLLMLSGATKLKDVENWTHPEELKPDYYLENMNVLLKILQNVR